jgi:hypothetical protein
LAEFTSWTQREQRTEELGTYLTSQLIDDRRRRGADSRSIALERKTAFCQQYQSTKENVDGNSRYITHDGLGFGPTGEVLRIFECLSRNSRITSET